MARNFLKTDEAECYKQIFKDYNKSKENLEEYIDILREWAKTQPHFPEKPTYRTLRFFVLCNKFSIERAKQRLDMYYTIRNMMPDWFRKDPLSPEMVLQSKIMYCVPLPKVTTDFKRILFVQLNTNHSSDVLDNDSFITHYINVVELALEADDCYGFHCIFNAKGIKFGHITNINPMTLKKVAICQEKVYSNRVVSIYLVNFPSFLEHFVNNVVKPILNPKLRERIKIYSGTDILLKDFGKSSMPKDVGGEESSLSELNELLLKQFETHQDRFKTLRTMEVDEALRPTKLINDDVLGYYGSFKKINVD